MQKRPTDTLGDGGEVRRPWKQHRAAVFSPLAGAQTTPYACMAVRLPGGGELDTKNKRDRL